MSIKSVFTVFLANALLCSLLLSSAGCHSIGPETIKRDRMHYSSAVSDSWKEQLLLNIVKTRYGDAPSFLEVSSVVAGYTLETGLRVNGQYSPPSLRGDTFAGGEIAGKLTDRPTITYAPLTGQKFAHGLMSPIPLDALWSVIEGGEPADFLLGLTVKSVEGHDNLGVYGGQFFPGDPEFNQSLQLIGSLQRAHATEFDSTNVGALVETSIQFRSGKNVANLEPQLARLKELLNIPQQTNRVKVVFDTTSAEPGIVGMRTRSLMQILVTLGAGVQVPSEHVAAGGIVRVKASQFLLEFTIHSSKEKPKQSFACAPYRDHWFWIDQTDLPSKTTLSVVTILFNFLEGSAATTGPVLTIPTN